MNTSVAHCINPDAGGHEGPTLKITQLLLGTVVEISCQDESKAAARAVINAAFKEVALIHHLMSFHDKDSDVSRLNGHPAGSTVTVNPRTVEVIRTAGEIARLTDGVFDITVAPELVSVGHLPPPAAACSPSPDASWRDIEIVADDAVIFHKPLWLDLGGIAKGYAVDRAFELCSSSGLKRCLVNAGGDIRVGEDITGMVKLDIPDGDAESTGCVELSGGSIASSCGWRNAIRHNGEVVGCHFSGVGRSKVDPTRFVSILAQDCVIADALTKVALALGEGARTALSCYSATALTWEKTTGWRQILS